MIDMAQIDAVEDWLIGQALQSAKVPDMFGEMCVRLRTCDVPVDRASLAWSALHPLIEGEMAYWQAGEDVLHEQYPHQEEEPETWRNSPMRAVLVNRDEMLRRRLDGANADHDYPICAELAEDGYTDYLVLATAFELPALADLQGNTGILVSWATKTPGGFTDDALFAIRYIQKRLALAARANLEAQITRTIAQTYLGGFAGQRVLSGQIRHGDGETIEAVIFYSDMRDSTAIAEDLGPDRYLTWLNTYFEVSAGAVLQHGGEILDFIGDAVLAVFPIDAGGLGAAVRKAVKATDEARRRMKELNASVQQGRRLRAGIALSVGKVMFGNIGIAERLTFSVIGQTVHAAARIEALTKFAGTDILMTEDVAACIPDKAVFVDTFSLTGFATKQPLYTLADPA